MEANSTDSPNGMILASASPRRQELMRRMGLKFDVVTSDAELSLQRVLEDIHSEENSHTNEYSSVSSEYDNVTSKHIHVYAHRRDPGEHALTQARLKANDVAARHPGRIIVAADTLVALDETILEKPRDFGDARRMLSLLSGRTHAVFTALVVIAGRVYERVCRTDVTFAELSPQEIDAYISTGEPMDKAGAYGIQGIGMRYITGINGDFYTVAGLPVHELYLIMRELGEL